MSFAIPFTIIDSKDFFEKIDKIVSSKKIKAIIVGVPLRTGEDINSSDSESKKFANKLSKKLSLPIFLIDERRTTKAADSLLLIAGYNRKDRNNMDDAVAAKLILESALIRIKNYRHQPLTPSII